MQLKTVLTALALSGIPLGAAAQTVIPSTTYGAGGPPAVVSGSSTIATNSNTVTVASGATVTYQASTSIDLTPGFHAVPGSNFYATIGTTVDTYGTGLPDVWQRAHGLTPSAGNAQTATTAGLTYLLEYQLGTNPTTTKQTDSGNSTQLKINRPTQ